MLVGMEASGEPFDGQPVNALRAGSLSSLPTRLRL